VDEKLVSTLRQDVDVLAVRIREIDGEAGADRADELRDVGSGGRRAAQCERQEDEEQGFPHADRFQTVAGPVN
jgi:hypothetical protein